MCQLDGIQSLKDEIYQLARRHNAGKMYVFGSCARKEETSESDVDFLADFNEKATLFDQVGLKLSLEDILQRKVDVIPMSSLADPDFGPAVRKDMVLL